MSTAAPACPPPRGDDDAKTTKHTTDFSRRVVPILGVPFDVVDMAQAAQRITEAIEARRPFFLSTPNLNFLALCQRDETFRRSVLQSDLSVADGVTVVLLARLFGRPLPERVAGSSLFDLIGRQLGKRLRVYLFGGPDGVAERAAQRLNEHTDTPCVVGWQSPGFGTVAQLSEPRYLQPISDSQPNFVLVALGAHKGQAWILRNLESLPNGVVSHLGAVIDFVAGSVKRAPRAVQALGLEWLWRIKERPSLWRRYWDDAVLVLPLVLRALFPRALSASHGPAGTFPDAHALIDASAERVELHLGGRWDDPQRLPELSVVLQRATDAPLPIDVHIDAPSRFSREALGLLLLLAGHQLKTAAPLQIHTPSEHLQRQLAAAGLAPWLQPQARSQARDRHLREAQPSTL